VAIWVSRALSLLLVARAVFAAWRARTRRGELLAALAFFPLCLLLSPITWKAHHVTLLPLLCCLAAAAVERARWSSLATFLAVYWVACNLVSEDVCGSWMHDLFESLSVVAWFDVLLIAIATRQALRARGDTASELRTSRSAAAT
jgi:hypothetical protein